LSSANLPGALLAPPGTYEVQLQARISTDTLIYTINGTVADLSGLGLWATEHIHQFDVFWLGVIENLGPDSGWCAPNPSFAAVYNSCTIGTSAPGSTELMDTVF
jgi:hypothetical protein